MTVARFDVFGQLDSAGGPQAGKVLIDRETGMFYVRPRGKKTLYEMPLSSVATMVCQMLARHRALEAQKEKAQKRAMRRRTA